MSTKTTFKRIALVAVAALGFGMLSVVPSFAADAVTVISLVDANATATSNAVAANGTLPVAANNSVSLDVYMDATAVTDAAGTISVALTVKNPEAVTVASSATAVAATTTGVTGAATGSTITLTAAIGADFTGNVKIGTVTFTPTMGGVYAITSVTTDGAITNTPNELAGTSTDGAVYVSGGGVKVASSGVGTSIAGAVVGGNAVVRFATARHAAATTTYNLTTSGVGVIQTVADGTLAPASIAGIAGATDFTQGAKVLTDNDATLNDVLGTVASTVAGVQTLTWSAISAVTGAPTTVAVVTITWSPTSSTAISSLSTAFLNSGAVYAASNAVGGVSLPKAASTAIQANIGVALKDANGNPVLGQKLTVIVSGPGAILVTQEALGTKSGTTSGVRAYSDASANASNEWMIGISADGTAGTSTITITVGTTLIATKTVTFYDAPAKVTATQVYSIARASSTGAALGSAVTNDLSTDTNVAAVYLNVTDVAGNDVAATVTCLSADLTVISGCTIAADSGTYGYGTGGYVASVTSAPNGVSGKSTTVVFRTQLASGAYVTSEPVTFTLGGSIATTVVTLDKTSYLPGEPMVLTVVGKDSAGNTTYDGQAMAYALSANKPVGGALPSASGKFALGKKATSATSPTLYAPALEGPFTITVTGNDVANTKVAVSAVVEGGATTAASQAAADAAAEATDAANAATDAANAAAEAADAATAAQDAADAVAALSASVSAMVSALKKQITALTNLVIKIQKKVRA